MLSIPTVTKTGIIIGSAYIPPAQRMSQDAEAIQAVLLERRRLDAEKRMRDAARAETYWKQDLLFMGCFAAVALIAILVIALEK